MKPNLNFHNEYYATIEKANRSRALTLINKMSSSKPGLLQEAKVEIRDLIDGGLEIYIGNTSAFDLQSKTVIFNYLNSIRKIGPF
jgi:hypothetical protein